MGFSDFRVKIFLRILLLTISITAGVFLYLNQHSPLLTFFLGSIILGQVYELYHFVTQINRQLRKFLESIKYSDFSSGFSSGNKLGKSFRDLNTSFNEVMNAFRQARSEKEEHWQYLNTVVEHVSVGVLSFDHDGNVGLMNAAAKKLIGVEGLRNIEELIEDNSWMYKALFDLPLGKSSLYTKQDAQLSLRATEIRLGNITYKLVALQNIQTELQKKELEAWQNLTRILRHEIMNSIAPIASLTSTMKDILLEDVDKSNKISNISDEALEDLEEGLITIEERSKGLIKFINAYRDYTTIPSPELRKVNVKELVEGVIALEKAELSIASIECMINIDPVDLILELDEEQIGQVLINLIKNSIEALQETRSPTIDIEAAINDEGIPFISIRDNGKGIIREALEKIFIPFYTTKPEGSGIGLALSRQIMQLHHGTLIVDSEPGIYTRFTLRF